MISSVTEIPELAESTINNSPDLFASKYASASFPSIKKRHLPESLPSENSIPASSLAPTYSESPTPITHSPPAILGSQLLF